MAGTKVEHFFDKQPMMLSHGAMGGYVLVLMAAVLWAVSGVVAKYLFSTGVTPYELVQLRTAAGALVVGVGLFFFKRQSLKISKRELWSFAILGIGGLAANQFFYFLTISRIKVGLAILLEFLAPSFIAMYCIVFRRQKPTPITVMCVIAASVGCCLALGIQGFDLKNLDLVGLFSGLMAALSLALYSLLGESKMARFSPWTVNFYGFLFAALFWNIAHSPLQMLGQTHSVLQWTMTAYVAVLGTVVPFGLYFIGLSLIGATHASITATMEPVAATLISFLFLNEILTPLQIVGVCVVLSSVVLLQAAKKPR